MNTQLEEFINQKKIEKIEEQKKKRDEHLVSLGLVDESKSKTIKVRKYFEYNIPGCKLDSSGRFYKEEVSYAPIEITDEEYEELLKYVPAPISTIQHKTEQSAKWANRIEIISTLSLIASIILVFCGIMVGVEFIVIGLYGVLYYPMIMGFAKIVEASEKQLNE